MAELSLDMKGIAWSRARLNGRRHFKDEKMAAAQKRIREEYALLKLPIITGPVRMYVMAVYEPPASWSNKKRAEVMGQPMMVKPDGDNVYKLVGDALNGVAYTDDARIADGGFSKHYGPADRLTIRVEAMP